MNTESNAIPDARPRAQVFAAADIPGSRRIYWSLRRELWESRSIYIAPVAVAALFLFGYAISMAGLPRHMRGLSALSPMQQHEYIEQPYIMAALLLMATTLVVAAFYCLDALHGERRDRSILFWKSLPVSDVMTVLSKAMVPIVIIPLLTFVVTVVTHVIMLVLSSAVLLGSRLSVAGLWGHLALLQMWPMLLYHLVALHGLWYAPFFGWLLLVSAWARRAPFLWAVLPPLAIGVVEKIAFNTSYFAVTLGQHFAGGSQSSGSGAGGMTMEQLTPLTPAQFVASPGLWIGLALTTAFLAGAVRLRRHRGPI
jgi:ABC-2 type transport system permease protein